MEQVGDLKSQIALVPVVWPDLQRPEEPNWAEVFQASLSRDGQRFAREMPTVVAPAAFSTELGCSVVHLLSDYKERMAITRLSNMLEFKGHGRKLGPFSKSPGDFQANP